MILWESDTGSKIVARVAIAGDFLPDWKPDASRPSVFTCEDWRKMANRLVPHFHDVAISFANCECTLDTKGLAPRPVDGLGQNISAAADSLGYLAAIRAVVGIANNHIYDFGSEGVQRTRCAIAQGGLVSLGAAHTLEEQPEVFVWRGPGQVRVGFWAAAIVTRTPSTRDFAGVEPATPQRARQALRLINDQHARFRVALLHAGHERASYPAPEEVRVIDALARSGFDIVAASHSHRISGAKVLHTVNRGPAFSFYGLGSIVSGYAASPLEREGLIIIAGFNAEGILARMEARSVFLAEDGFGATSPADSDPVLERFSRLSAHIADDSYIPRFYREISPGLVRLYLRDSRRAFEQSGVPGLARKVRRIRLRHIRRLMHSVLP